MENARKIEPFENCPSLDGYHCVTSSLAKIFHYYGQPLSEDMLLGLGAGMGFIYWQKKSMSSCQLSFNKDISQSWRSKPQKRGGLLSADC